MIADRVRTPHYPERREAVFPAGAALPGADACVALAEDGIAAVRLEEPVDLRDPASLEALRFVRDCVATGIVVRWTVSHGGDIDPYALMHLWPPDAFPGSDEKLALWRDFAFGVLYWRLGPGFASVRDVRPAWEPAFYTLDDDGTLEAFEALQVPVACELLPGEILASFREARLVAEIGGVALALPFRIKKWPIPFLSV